MTENIKMRITLTPEKIAYAYCYNAQSLIKVIFDDLINSPAAEIYAGGKAQRIIDDYKIVLGWVSTNDSISIEHKLNDINLDYTQTTFSAFIENIKKNGYGESSIIIDPNYNCGLIVKVEENTLSMSVFCPNTELNEQLINILLWYRLLLCELQKNISNEIELGWISYTFSKIYFNTENYEKNIKIFKTL